MNRPLTYQAPLRWRLRADDDYNTNAKWIKKVVHIPTESEAMYQLSRHAVCCHSVEFGN
jgi:hypothetical protein